MRLVGAYTDDTWKPASVEADDVGQVIAASGSGASWVKDRLAHGDDLGAGLSFVCVGVDGGVCSWLTAPSKTETVLSAAMGQLGEGGWAGDGTGASSRLGVWGSPPGPIQEATIQALGDAVTTQANGKHKEGDEAGSRMAVLALPDAGARLFLDALDERNIRVSRVVSIWHAISAVWDPAGPIRSQAGGSGGDRVVATASPVTATVLLDPTGRFVWAWSRAGELLAAGSMRLEPAHGAHDEDEEALATPEPSGVCVTKAEVGRLCTEWLSWSAQLGVAPARVICIGRLGEGGLDGGLFGQMLGASWPGATIDFAVVDDPISETLRQLAIWGGGSGGLTKSGTARTESPGWSLVGMSHRPGSAHRSLYRWAAASLLTASAAVGAWGYQAWSVAGSRGDEKEQITSQWRELVAKTDPAAALNAMPLVPLQALRDQLKPVEAPPAAAEIPVLEVLEQLSLVLNAPSLGVQITELELSNFLVPVRALVEVPDSATGDELRVVLPAIEGLDFDWDVRFFREGKNGEGLIYEILTDALDSGRGST